MIPKDRLDSLAREFRIGPYACAEDIAEKGSDTKFSLSQKGDDFVFSNLPGIEGKVKLLGALADDGSQKTQPQWFDYSKTNDADVVVPNSRVLYQIMRQLYYSRNDNKLHDLVESCVSFFRTNYDASSPWKYTGSKVAYQSGLAASVMHLGTDKTVQSIDCDIPEFTRQNNDWSYLVLAKEQPEIDLGTMDNIPDDAKPVLEALLGEGYEEAGAVCQYIASRKNNNLREVRLWTPTNTNRNAERAVVLGVYISDWFNINADGGIGGVRPALGVVYTGKKMQNPRHNAKSMQQTTKTLKIARTVRLSAYFRI